VANPKEEIKHAEALMIVKGVADELKGEELISDWDTKQFKIDLKEWKPFTVNPDLTLHVPGKRKILVEIINPEKPKRYIGEILYAHILGSFQKIGAVVFLVLPRGEKSQRAMVEQILLNNLFIRKTISHLPIYLDPTDKDTIYMVLKDSVTTYRKKGKLY